MRDDRPHGMVLVVDDNVDIRGLAKRFLEMAGYAVVTAADGEEGLRFYEKHRPVIVLLLTDVVMPKLNGFDLADRVLGMDAELPVILMSGDAGCDHRDLTCLAKPFRPAELIETVSRMVSANAHSRKTLAHGAV
jgi:CheY-like chemotaxis protein